MNNPLSPSLGTDAVADDVRVAVRAIRDLLEHHAALQLEL